MRFGIGVQYLPEELEFLRVGDCLLDLLLGWFEVFRVHVGKEIVELHPVAVCLEEHRLRSEHPIPKLFVTGFPLIDGLERPTNPIGCGLFDTILLIEADALILLGHNLLLLG